MTIHCPKCGGTTEKHAQDCDDHESGYALPPWWDIGQGNAKPDPAIPFDLSSDIAAARLRELAAGWREQAKHRERYGEEEQADVLDQCATDLEAEADSLWPQP